MNEADEATIDAILAEYLLRRDRGEEGVREDVVRKNPERRAELVSYFEAEDRLGVSRDATIAFSKHGETAGAVLPRNVRYFGDYEILDEIARGGMGVVYRARQLSLNREVALKLILSGPFARQEDVRRFRAEAEAAASLDHPGIVPIYEVGEHEGQHYFSMRLVEGGSLASRAAAFRTPRQAAELMVAVARAVDFAHRRGILHRDLKPANVLLDGAGRPLVGDFGLAKRFGGEEGETAAGAVLGTPAYMSPEQAGGAARGLTTAADVWGLGAMLYFVLTSSPPFGGPNVVATLRQVVEEDPPLPSSLNGSVDRDLEAICLRCLTKDPSRRYPSAEAFAGDLERWLAGEPVEARPVAWAGRAGRWARRRPVVASLLTALLLAVLGGTAAVLWQWNRAESALRMSERHLYASLLSETARSLDSGDAAGALAALAGAPERARGVEHGVLLEALGRPWSQRLDLPPATLALSPNGRYLAIGRPDGVLEVRDARNGEVEKTWDFSAEDVGVRGGRPGALGYPPPAWSAGSRFLVVGDPTGMALRVVDRTQARSRKLSVRFPPAASSQLSTSAPRPPGDGRERAIAETVARGAFLARVSSARALAVSGDGSRVALLLPDTRIPLSWAQAPRFPGPLAYSLLVFQGDRLLGTVDLPPSPSSAPEGEERGAARVPASERMVFSEGGDRLAVLAANALHEVRLQGERLEVSWSEPANGLTLSYASDGALLLVGGRAAWRYAAGDPGSRGPLAQPYDVKSLEATYAGHLPLQEPAFDAAIHPGGRHATLAMRAGVFVVDLSTGQLSRALKVSGIGRHAFGGSSFAFAFEDGLWGGTIRPAVRETARLVAATISGGGDYVATSDAAGRVRVFSRRRPAPEVLSFTTTRPAEALFASEDGSVLASLATANPQGPAPLLTSLELHAVPGGRKLFSEEGLPQPDAMALSPSGDAFALAASPELLLLDARAGVARWKATVPEARAVQFSVDGASVHVLSRTLVASYEARSSRAEWNVSLDGLGLDPTCFSVSAGADRVAVGTTNGFAVIERSGSRAAVASRKPLRRLVPEGVEALAFSKGDRLAVLTSRTGRLLIYDVEGRRLLSVRPEDARVYRLTFHGEGVRGWLKAPGTVRFAADGHEVLTASTQWSGPGSVTGELVVYSDGAEEP